MLSRFYAVVSVVLLILSVAAKAIDVAPVCERARFLDRDSAAGSAAFKAAAREVVHLVEKNFAEAFRPGMALPVWPPWRTAVFGKEVAALAPYLEKQKEALLRGSDPSREDKLREIEAGLRLLEQDPETTLRVFDDEKMPLFTQEGAFDQIVSDIGAYRKPPLAKRAVKILDDALRARARIDPPGRARNLGLFFGKGNARDVQLLRALAGFGSLAKESLPTLAALEMRYLAMEKLKPAERDANVAEIAKTRAALSR